MDNEHNSVRLEVTHAGNLPPRYTQVHTNFSGAESAITYLRLHEELLMSPQNRFRITDLMGTLVMENDEIREKARKR